ncbi:MAG: DNA recombination protein RmuC [Planctomycetes bacterium]|nr:DNA recombination protein RmuC [Planctomycetota bacterium]
MEWPLFAVGLALGAVLGRFFFARALEGRIHAAEARAGELQKQIEGLEKLRAELEQRLLAAETARVQAETRLQEAGRTFEEQRKLLDEAKLKLADTFKALAMDVLSHSKNDFLQLADQTLETRRQAVDQLVAPIRDSLGKVDQQIHELEKARSEAYGALRTQVSDLAATHGRLQAETANLVRALKTPEVRGRWGEIQLRRVVEVAGMQNHCDFQEQQTVATEDGQRRPDMVVRLPEAHAVVVDAKAPLKAYIEALDAADDETRAQKLKEHARHLRTHVDQLADKRYWNQFQPAPEFVALFLPGEAFFSAALQQDPDLIEYAALKKVMLTSPTTLIALLRAVHYGWRRHQIAESAEKISRAGQELHSRIGTIVGYLDSLGRALGQSVEHYNRLVGSMEERMIPAARKLAELGASSGKDIESAGTINLAPRLPAAESPDGEKGVAELEAIKKGAPG